MNVLKKTLLSLMLGSTTVLAWYTPASAQTGAESAQDDPALKIYRASPTKINDLVHTKLDVRFDYAKKYLYGKAWITLKPHFYTTDSLTLDAKGMDIKQVAVVKGGKNSPLKFEYDGWELKIQLDKSYKNNESYIIYIDYTAKPDELKVKGSAAINDAKGLYFINPDGSDPKKPIQIWTQGETEASSAWFPTIDKNNQKTTEEISMTVEKKYVTLSNGKLVSQKNNADGTRTDTWKLDLPHAPYLFMMAVGDFAIIKDKWKGKEVNYYVEHAYAPYAKSIFGNTPEMLSFYSNILGYEYAWPKYSQIVVRDYVSGAMENTTATLHGDFLQKTNRELLDDNKQGESVIAHELFHQWFGDLATCESWSNLTLNESFADYSEYLWFEHKYGKDMADDHSYKSLNNYIQFSQYAGDRDLVRYHYHDKEDMFDAVSYQKGGRILNMLRNYVGDSAFFKSLNLYLKTNAFKATEAHQLRLAFEEVTGKDLNWFFNQWYFGQGYPELDISYIYDDAAKKVSVVLQQQQKTGKVFQLPMAIDVYAGGKKERHQVVMNDAVDTFTFSYTTKPEFVNVDGDKVLLAKKTDHRDLNTYVYQFKHAPLYLDRREAIEACLKQQTSNEEARKVVAAALKDKFHVLRGLAIRGLKLDDAAVKQATAATLATIAKNDDNALVRTAALHQLGELKDPQYAALFEAATKDSSYAAAGSALTGLLALNPDKAYTIAKEMESTAKGGLSASIAEVYAKKGNNADVAFFSKSFEEAGSGQAKFDAAIQYLGILSNIDNTDAVIKGIDQVKAMADGFKNNMVNNYLINIMQPMVQKKQQKAASSNGNDKAELTKQSEYIQKVLQQLKDAGANGGE
jgi:aminopeptidase N